MPVVFTVHAEKIPVGGSMGPVADATVRILKKNGDVWERVAGGTTNANGDFCATIQDPGQGKLKFKVIDSDYCDEVLTITEYPGSVTAWHENFQLHSDGTGAGVKGEDITVEVVEDALENPPVVSGAAVEIASGTKTESGNTDANGKWTGTGFKSNDDLTITVTHEDYQEEKLRIESPRGFSVTDDPVAWTAKLSLRHT